MSKPHSNGVTMTSLTEQSSLECAREIGKACLYVKYVNHGEDINGPIIERVVILNEEQAAAIIEAHVQQRCAALWQPIDTAPKDGTNILIYGKNGTAAARWVFDLLYDEDENLIGSHPTKGRWIFLSSYQMYFEEWATHWQPLTTLALAQFKGGDADA